MKPVALGAAAVAAPDLYTMDINAVQLFAGGMIDGLIMKDNLPEMQKCLGDAKTLAPEVQKIVNEMAKGDLSDVIARIKDAVALIKSLPTEFKECENVQGDIGTINSDMTAGEYVEAGETAADVVILALGKIEQPAPEVAYLY